MRIAITGATGQLGRAIVNGLLAGGVDATSLRAVVRSPERAADFAGRGVEVRAGDYEDPPSLVEAFGGVDVLLFISNTDVARRAVQHENVVAAAGQAGVGQVVYTSIIQTPSPDPLTRSHAATEEALKATGIPTTFLRNNFYADLYVNEVGIAMKTGVYRSPRHADAGASLVARGDIARTAVMVLRNAARHAGQAYDLTGPAPVTPLRIAETAAALAGVPVTHQAIDWDTYASDLAQRGLPEGLVQVIVGLERFIGSNALAGVSDAIEKLTGTPPQDFTSFVRDTLGMPPR